MQPRHDKLPQRLTDDSEEEGDGQENYCETYGAERQRVVVAVRDNGEVADIYSYGHSPTRQPSWWVVRLLAVLSLVLLINIALLLVTRRPFSATSSSTASGSAQQQQQARISERLNNATIPNWKPLPDPSQILTHIAFGSCLSQEMPQPVWDTLLAQQQVDDTAAPAGPDLVLLMGDNVYGDCAHDDCFLLRQAYRTWANHPSLQGAASQLSVYATLDDHDYGMADCSDTNPHKELARQLFAEFFNLVNLPVDGVYRASAWGPPGQRLQVILLDTRYSRSAFVETQDPASPYRPINDTIDGDPQQQPQQMLSEQQWMWLEQQLNEPADLRLVVSSVQVLNQATGFEAWRHLPQEQSRLMRLLQNKRAILLSGDRHVGGFYEFDGLIEVTSSSMTHTIPLQSEFCNGTVPADCDEVDAARVGDWVRQNHYGIVEIDWDQQLVRLSLRRTESSYGAPYSTEVQELYRAQHGKFSDAGQILVAREYSFADL